MYESRLSNGSFGDECFGLLTKGVVPQVVGHSPDAPKFLGQIDEASAFSNIHGERFLAQDVLASSQKRSCLFVVKIVWRADVNDIYVGIGREFYQ